MLKHAFVAPRSDDPDPTLVNPSNWNADHVLDGGNDGDHLVRDSTAPTGASWHPPPEGILADGSEPFTGDQSMGGNRITDVADPTDPQDAATKTYVDGQAAAHDSGFRKLTYVAQRIGFPAGVAGQRTLWTFVVPANTLLASGQLLELEIFGDWGTQANGNRQVYVQINPANQPNLSNNWFTLANSGYNGGPGPFGFAIRMMRSAPSEIFTSGINYIPGVGALVTLGRPPIDCSRSFTIEVNLITDQPSDASMGLQSVNLALM